ncbi:Uncharacterised protein [Sphingobacterium mizutaii]|uniref:Uncharacterized protein n=1 Tax=Sphingobacterium mizutaii TaxID=1010 RepID=A0AAJ4XBV0_9SPHI|nr:hypothetical protein SAMN05192578_1011078 [Sphingobacterium mizutaii]SNV50864.1 Uncharacterised protein [Sphingobacterium mizutaii]
MNTILYSKPVPKIKGNYFFVQFALESLNTDH